MKELERDALVLLKYFIRLSRERDIIKAAEILSELGREMVDAQRCVIWVKEKNSLWRMEKQERVSIDLRASSSLISDVLLNNKLIMTAAPSRCLNYNAEIDGTAKCLIALPVYRPDSGGEIIGVIQLSDKKTEKPFSNADLKMANSFERLAGGVLSSLLQDMEHEKDVREIIYSLAETGERRQQKMSSHVRRVASYCALIAERMGLSPEEVKIIYQASPLHDIGKMTIPDFVLLKPAKLTREEFSLIKAHTQNGSELLQKSDNKIMQAASVIALQHHEKYDGTGYPRGLAGDEIHIFAQITALADVFDVLTLESVYREPWPLDDALELIRSEAGKQFSPVVAEAFFAVLPKIMRVRELYPDEDESEKI